MNTLQTVVDSLPFLKQVMAYEGEQHDEDNPLFIVRSIIQLRLYRSLIADKVSLETVCNDLDKVYTKLRYWTVIEKCRQIAESLKQQYMTRSLLLEPSTIAHWEAAISSFIEESCKHISDPEMMRDRMGSDEKYV